MAKTLLDLLNQEQKAALLHRGKTLQLASGAQVFEKGESAQQIFLVRKGKITLYRLTPNGEEKVFKVFWAGGLIAEMAIFMQPRVYPMSAKADQLTQLTAISRASIVELLQSSPELYMLFMEFMAGRVNHLMNTVDILTQANASQRLVMRFAELYRQQQGRHNRFFLPCTKRLLASQLGITPETLSRIFNGLIMSGLIEESGASITVPNFNRLCNQVNLLANIFEDG